MPSRKQIILILIGLAVFAGALRLASAKTGNASEGIASPLTKKIQSALDLVDQFYIQDPQPQTVIDGALKGLAAGLDEGSEYLTPLEYEQLSIEAKGDYVGIGIVLGKQTGFWTLKEVFEGSPAGSAGLRPGDRLIAVNGKNTTSLSLSEVIRLLEGPTDSSVKLLISSSEAKREVMLVRKKIEMDTLGKVFVSPDRVGYIRCLDFSDRTPQDLRSAIEKLSREDIRGLVLDLRGNAGGVFDAAIDTAKLFLKKDQVIVSTRGRSAEDEHTYRADGPGPVTALPLVILTDRLTASAAEILSASLQENKRAVLVGQKTYGKASIQSVFPLEDGSALRLTTAFYYTPSGKLIQKNGITPNIDVHTPSPNLSHKGRGKVSPSPLMGEGWGEGEVNDPVFQKAVEILTR